MVIAVQLWKTTELNTLKCCTLWNVIYISIKVFWEVKKKKIPRISEFQPRSLFPPVMDCMFVSLPNSYVETLPPKGMILGDGTFGRQLNHESEALMDGIDVTRALASSFCSLSCWGDNKRFADCNSEAGWHPDLRFLASKLLEINFCWKKKISHLSRFLFLSRKESLFK